MDMESVDENNCSASYASHTEILKNLALKCTENIENSSKDKIDVHYEPGISKPIVKNILATENNIVTTETVVRTENNETDSESKSQVDIKPLNLEQSFYKVHRNLVSKPVISNNLLKQFNSLPVFGRPKHKNELEQFFNNKIREFVGYDLDDNEFDKLAQYCSPDHLKTGDELQMFTNIPTSGPFPSVEKLNEKRIIEEAAERSQDINLCLYKKFQLRVENDKRNYYSKRLKYRGIRLMPLYSLEEDNGHPAVTIGQPLEPGKDLLYRVRIYRPYLQNYRHERCRLRVTVFNCDAVLLGRQRLSALRDRVVCTNDVGMRTDVADCPYQTSEANAKSVFPSGFMFINNVFYVDRRPGCRDTSAVVRQWAKKRGLGDFPCMSMDQRLHELPLRLGHPEVYVHQGNCEHVFTFSEVRLLGPRDPLRPSSYPAHTAAANIQSIYCTTCAEFGAKWLVVDCPRVPFNPAFFCETCFKLYLYKDGTKIGQFKAYNFRGNELNMLKPQG